MLQRCPQQNSAAVQLQDGNLLYKHNVRRVQNFIVQMLDIVAEGQ